MFNMTKLLFSYPTTVVIIDDNKEYLNSIINGLNKKGQNCIGFTSPREALSYILSKPNQYRFTSALKEIDEDSPLSSTTSHLCLDLSNIYREAFTANKENEISVIIIDYNMPELSGDQFASTIADNNIKKLMLTGWLDNQKAITLLNEDIIDSYIEKSTTNNIDKIYEKVMDLQYRYFLGLSKQFTKIFVGNDSVINSKEYANVLQEIASKNNIHEQYLLSKNGSRLFINTNQEQTWLVLAHEDDFEGWAETASLANADESVIYKLKSRSHMLFLFTEEETELDPKNWLDFLYPVYTLISDKKIYYASINLNKKFT